MKYFFINHYLLKLFLSWCWAWLSCQDEQCCEMVNSYALLQKISMTEGIWRGDRIEVEALCSFQMSLASVK